MEDKVQVGQKGQKAEIMPPSEARRVLDLYPFLSFRDRLTILARLVFCIRPIMEILGQNLPKSGLTVDLGCGYGVISHLVTSQFPDMAVIGFDMSSRRIEAARRSANNGENVDFYASDVRQAEIPSSDAVIIIDILSMLSYRDQESLLNRCYEKLRDGGVLIVKDNCKKPYWKYVYVYFEDIIKTKIGVFGEEITEHSLHFWDAEDFLDLLSGIGFATRAIPLRSNLPYPGVFYVCRK